MPIPAAVAGAAIQGGTNILTNAMNAISQGFTNRAERRWNESMYARQNADQIKFWNMQNDYNSPKAQMERFKQAGLNPNLIYGQTNTADPIRVSDVKSWNPHAPQFDLSSLGNVMQGMYDLEVKQAQTDNLKTATQVAIQDASLRQIASIYDNAEKSSRIAKTNTDRNLTQYNLEQAQRLQSTLLEKAQLENETLRHGIAKTQSDISFTRSENIRADKRTELAIRQGNMGIQEGAERILSSQAQRTKVPLEREQISRAIEILKTDNELKGFEKILKAAGLHWGDERQARVAVTLANYAMKKAEAEGKKDKLAAQQPLKTGYSPKKPAAKKTGRTFPVQ